MMAINKNHEFEELNGIKCGIIERNVSHERLKFLKDLLEHNAYTVVAVPSPAPKQPAAPASKSGEEPLPPPVLPPAPETFTVGVTDITFNPVNGIFGRMLKTRKGHVVTLAYWRQEEAEANEEIPYFQKTLD